MECADSEKPNLWSAKSSPCLDQISQWLVGRTEEPRIREGIQLPSEEISRSGFDEAKQFTENALEAHQIGYGTSSIDDVFYRLCRSVPGLCTDYLKESCSNLTEDRLVRNPTRVFWCGCHLQENVYRRYYNDFGIRPECHPLCARKGNIGLVSSNGIDLAMCQQNTCIIDQNLLILGSGKGIIGFEQYCGGCTEQGGTCQCIIAGNNIASVTARLETSSIELKQHCGQIRCYRHNPDPQDTQMPSILEVSCDAPNHFNPFDRNSNNSNTPANQNGTSISNSSSSLSSSSNSWQTAWGIILIIIIIIIGVFLLLSLLSYRDPSGEPLIKLLDRSNKKSVRRDNPVDQTLIYQ